MRMFRSGVIYGVLALTPLFMGGASALGAQQERHWTVTPMGGVLDWDFANEDFAMFALRFDRPISKWVRFEVESTLARVEVQELGGFFDPNGEVEKSSLGTLTIGFQARYETEYVEPYAGFSFGLFARRDDDSDSVRSSQSTLGFPVGVRVFLTDKLGLRAELRLRRDQTAFGVSSNTNYEKTVGISWTFGSS